MNQVKKLKQLANLSHFDKNTLSQMIEISDNSLYANIKRWLKEGELIQLKKGLYVTKEYLNRASNREVYNEFIANKLREPSYLSLEYILQKHSLLSEAVFGITSITLKSKRKYHNDLGLFIYQSIKEKLFTGYDIKRKNNFEIKEATKAKALFDYLYLKLWRVKSINIELFDSLRLNLDEFTEGDLKEFLGYCQLSGVEKFNNLPKLIEVSRDR